MQRTTLLVMLSLVAATSAQSQNPTVIVLSAIPASATLGQAVTLTATVTPLSATGKVTFYDGTAILGVAPLKSGSASLATIGIGYGKRLLTARYGGDSNDSRSISPALTEHIVTKPGGTLVAGTGTAYLEASFAIVALADLNHDENADVVAIGSAGLAPGSVFVYLGNKDGTFQAAQSYLPGLHSISAAVADINMDGNADLLVTGTTGLMSLIGKGDGTFTNGVTILDTTDLSFVSVADINGDGKPDVLLLRRTSPTVEVLLGNGDGTFQTSSPLMLTLASPPSGLLVADFNGDGYPDLAVANPDLNCVTIFLGTSEGTFSAPAAYTSYSAFSLATGDLNNDGKPDLLIGGGSTTFDLLLGNGDGTFAPAQTMSVDESSQMLVGVFPIEPCDFDGDGNTDIILADNSSDLFVLLGNGDGTFRAPWWFQIFASNGPVIGDLNHDGIVDLVATGLPDAIQPWLGALSPTFALAVNPTQPMQYEPVTLNVTCNYPDATGTLSFTNFEDTGTFLGTAPLANGSASLNLGPLATGLYNIRATYSGDSKYAPTNLPELFFLVEQPSGTLQFSASPNPAVPGQLITLTAIVPISVGNPAVAFFDGTTLLDWQTSYSQTVTFTTPLSAGLHQLTALMPPYFGYLPASATLVENIIAKSGGTLIPGPSYRLSPSITQAIALDVNLDGFPDLVVLDPGNSELSFLLNLGNGKFGSPVYTHLGFVPGAMVATGNSYTSSVSQDFAVTNPAGNSVVNFECLLGEAYVAGTTPVAQQPVAIASADFDGDGKADLVTANAGSNNVSLILTKSAHPITLAAGTHPDAIVAGDFNHDGKADFAVANETDNDVMVFLGNGGGTFKPPVITSAGSGPTVLLAADLNGDSKTDLVVIDSGSNEATILLSNGDGTFRTSATYALGSTASAAVLADMNADNRLDLVVTTASGLLIFAGNGDGTFDTATNNTQYAGAASVVAAPFDNDGRMDLAVTLPPTSSVALVVNGTPTTTTLRVSSSSANARVPLKMTATVSPAVLGGTVTFYDGVTPIGGGPVNNSKAVFSTALLLPGAHSLSALFSGGSGYGASSSKPVMITVSAFGSSGLSAPIRQTFADAPVNLIPGDFNNDGIEDLAFWRDGNGLRVLLGNGNGTFIELPAGTAMGGAPAVTADFNDDGNTDIVYVNGALTLAAGDGKGGFRDAPVYGSGPSIAAADFNGDGNVDIVIADPIGTVDVILGVGNGTFQLTSSNYPAGSNPVLVATGDFNGDGKPDVLVVNSISGGTSGAASTQVSVLLGKSDGSLASALPAITIAGSPVSVALGDFNADGHLDVAIAEQGTNTAAILLGKGDGTFAPPSTVTLSATPAQVLVADMDGDGHPDLIVMFTSVAPALAVCAGQGDGTFGVPKTYSDVLPPSAIAVGDMNGDGVLDVVLAESNTINVFLGIPLVVSPSSLFIDATSQTASISVKTNNPDFPWTASTASGFITVTSGASGTGNGTVTLSVTANTTGADRTGTVTVADQTVSVLQRANEEIFTDVVPLDYYFDFANLMYQDGITSGCSASPLEYCPDSTTTRAEMAVFVIAGIEGSNQFTYSTTPYFTDVPPSSPFFKFVQKMKDLGITAGCTATTYCPNDPVTRGEMAVFIIVGRYGTIKFTYPDVPYFTDVPFGSTFFPFVQKMAQDGITAGCGGGLYCPDTALTRGQMAVFVVTGLRNQLFPATVPVITQASPGSASAGETVTVTLTASGTHFLQDMTQVTVPTGISASNVTVVSPTSLTLQLAISSSAVSSTSATNGGPYSIIVITGLEEADLPNGFIIQ